MLSRVASIARIAAVAAARPAVTRTVTASFSSNATTATTGANESKALKNAGLIAASAVAFTGAFFIANQMRESNKINAATSLAGVQGTPTERSFIALKPDAIQRGLIAEIIGRLEKKGYRLVGIKLVNPSVDLVEKHYEDLKGRPFFNGLVQYMAGGPVLAMVWEGPNIVKTVRHMLGATNPNEAPTGSIRGDLFLSTGRNGVHASDAFATAEQEIALWFKESELVNWKRTNDPWIIATN